MPHSSQPKKFIPPQPAPSETPDNEAGIKMLGHREFVGGLWEEIGKLQFDFLVAQGLLPSHCLLDVACGSLRGGVHFIKYLDAGNYLGLDKEQVLLTAGIEKELGRAAFEEKRPEFVVSQCFEFKKFSKTPQFSIAQSLFTHLNPPDLRLCLRNLRAFVAPGHRFFATFFEGNRSRNLPLSHSRVCFYYSRKDLEQFGVEAGWRAIYIGNWNHPRNQMMMLYES
jgi:SAM-dependent methyltransferase